MTDIESMGRPENTYEFLEIKRKGKFCLVPEHELDTLRSLAMKAEAFGLQTAKLDVANLVRHFRSQRGYSRALLAKKARVGERQIQNIEKEKTKTPHLKTLRKLADVFGEPFVNGLRIIGIDVP